MNPGEWVTTAVTEYSKTVVVVLLVLTAGVGYGATDIKQSSSVEQFQSDTPEARALDYVNENFSQGESDTTTVQVVVRDGDGNVLSRDSLIRSLRYQRTITGDGRVSGTLAGENAVVGVSNVVARTAIRLDQFENVSARARELQGRSRELNATVDRLSAALNETRRLQAEYDRLNASRASGEIDQSTYRQRADRIESDLRATRENATSGLDAEGRATFGGAMSQVRILQSRLFRLNVSLRQGEIDEATYREEAGEVREGFAAAYRQGTRGVLADEFRTLRSDFGELRERQRAIAEGPAPSLEEQIATLESMNDSEVQEIVTAVLSREGPGSLFEGPGGGSPGGEAGNATGGFGGGDGNFAFRLMSNDYEPGSPTANARVMIVRQSTDGGAVQGPSGPEDAIVDAQLAMEDLVPAEGSEEYLVFGFGKISDEIQRSQNDSLKLVAPLALAFVLLTLLVAYRDLLDILLGIVGIVAVLAWAFGAMGWAGIAFNQVMVAVPVLLIGLSIDYAIHVFMRHREQRTETGEGPRGSMRVALAGVGMALVWVTATTVIGFLSNYISPLPPIRDFGLVSSAGIVGALLVFALLIPALKVELDAALESVGLDRTKRAFGTGEGYLARALSVGATAARRAPAVVIVLSLLVTAGGAYGGSQVDTSFSQEDFLAEDPPAWMDELPEQIRPSDYSAKAELDYVNRNFRREDSQSQVLMRGEVATPAAMERMARADRRAADSPVTFVLSNGDPSIDSPLRTMRAVAARNESFNATFAAADTDGDGVPDENVEGVYDALFATAPEQAGAVIQRRDGDYVAARMVVGTKGDASTRDVTDAARGFADELEGDGMSAQATGSQVVNEVVQQDLLNSVIESLFVSIGAVFLFLMVAYRITEGSATLGLVTLLPVALSVAWILGTMFVLGVPFNVLTGTITSLTIGLGVAYSIHISDRYRLELDRQGDVRGAMHTAVTGTGGALLGSAATTVGGFGTLMIAILPPLQQFGLITAITIVYAFLASVLVLPSLLVVWTRYAGPDVPMDASRKAIRGPEAQSDVIDPATDADPDADDPIADEAPDAGGATADPDEVTADPDDVTADPDDVTVGPDEAAAAVPGESDDEESDPDGPDDGSPERTEAPAGESEDDADDGSAEPGDEPSSTDSDDGEGVEATDDEEVDEAADDEEVDDEATDDRELGEEADDAEDPSDGEDDEADTDGEADAEEGLHPFGGQAKSIPDPTEAEPAGPAPVPGSTDDGESPDDEATVDRAGSDDGESPDDGTTADDPGTDGAEATDDGADAEGVAPDDPDDSGGSGPETTGPTGSDGAAAVEIGSAAAPESPEQGPPDPVRRIEPEYPVPGDTVRVTVEADDREGRTMLVEALPAAEVGLESLAPDPVSYAHVDGSVYALWEFDEPTSVTLEYVVAIPEDATPGEGLDFEGRIETGDGDVPVGGAGSVRVVSELEARAASGEDPSVADLELASRRAAEGELPQDRLEWLYRQWLGDAGDELPAAAGSPVDAGTGSAVEFDPPGRREAPASNDDGTGGTTADDPGNGEEGDGGR